MFNPTSWSSYPPVLRLPFPVEGHQIASDCSPSYYKSETELVSLQQILRHDNALSLWGSQMNYGTLEDSSADSLHEGETVSNPNDDDSLLEDPSPVLLERFRLNQNNENFTRHLIISSKVVNASFHPAGRGGGRTGRQTIELLSVAIDRQSLYLRRATLPLMSDGEKEEGRYTVVAVLPHRILPNPGEEQEGAGGGGEEDFQKYFAHFDCFAVQLDSLSEQHTDSLFRRETESGDGNPAEDTSHFSPHRDTPKGKKERVDKFFLVTVFDVYVSLIEVRRSTPTDDPSPSSRGRYTLRYLSQIRLHSHQNASNITCVQQLPPRDPNDSRLRVLVGTSKGMLHLYQWDLPSPTSLGGDFLLPYTTLLEHRVLDLFDTRYLKRFIENNGELEDEEENSVRKAGQKRNRKRNRVGVLSDGIRAIQVLQEERDGGLRLLVAFHSDVLGLSVLHVPPPENDEKGELEKERVEPLSLSSSSPPNLRKRKRATTRVNGFHYYPLPCATSFLPQRAFTSNSATRQKKGAAERKLPSFFLGTKFQRLFQRYCQRKCQYLPATISPTDDPQRFIVSDQAGNWLTCRYDRERDSLWIWPREVMSPSRHSSTSRSSFIDNFVPYSFANFSKTKFISFQHQKVVTFSVPGVGQGGGAVYQCVVLLHENLHARKKEPFATVYVLPQRGGAEHRTELYWPDGGYPVQSPQQQEGIRGPLQELNNALMRQFHVVMSVSILGNVLVFEANMGVSLVYRINWIE